MDLYLCPPKVDLRGLLCDTKESFPSRCSTRLLLEEGPSLGEARLAGTPQRYPREGGGIRRFSNSDKLRLKFSTKLHTLAFFCAPENPILEKQLTLCRVSLHRSVRTYEEGLPPFLSPELPHTTELNETWAYGAVQRAAKTTQEHTNKLIQAELRRPSETEAAPRK
jgi:hypothetical protein